MAALHHQDLQPFPDLPVDIARRILEISTVDDRVTALNLVLVCKAVRAWIEPILYNTIVIDSRQRLVAVLLSIELRNDPIFFATHVKRLCIWDRWFGQGMLSPLLLSLSGVVSLAWWSSDPFLIRFVARPRYLSLVCMVPFCKVQSALSPNLTHMNLDCRTFDLSTWCPYIVAMDASAWSDIFARCPALTHLMFNLFNAPVGSQSVDAEVGLIVRILSASSPAFKVFILLIEDGCHPDWVGDLFSDVLSDSRVMVVDTGPYRGGVSCESYFHYEYNPDLDWQCMPTSRMTVWEFADLQLRRRVSRN